MHQIRGRKGIWPAAFCGGAAGGKERAVLQAQPEGGAAGEQRKVAARAMSSPVARRSPRQVSRGLFYFCVGGKLALAGGVGITGFDGVGYGDVDAP